MSSYRDVIQKARKPENQKTEQPELQHKGTAQSGVVQDQMPPNGAGSREEEVNLSIKVPKSLRRHWVSEAKRQDTTITAVIREALQERFGEPQEA